MSKTVKNLLINDLRSKLQQVNDCLLVNVIGLNSEKTSKLRAELRKKNIRLQVIKNSMARRAAEGTAVAPALSDMEGTLAIVWGSEDVVSLAKEVIRLAEAKEFQGFEPRGGAIEGAKIPAAQVKVVSTWPSRAEQLSILVGQILGPGATLAAQLNGAGGTLAGQIKQKIEDLEKDQGANETGSEQ
jgi:large subunit ribosomal protein L10